MADFKEREEEQQESKIPVFTVLKNGVILKNIFILNSPVSPSSSVYDSRSNQEEIVIVGRHPDCNIVLTHPSISRFHVQINAKPYSQKLSVTGLGSVHGTWLSGNKIEPGVTVDMAEGDTLKVGSSTRIYRLQWVPLSWAYDMESPFVISDASMAEIKEEEETIAEAHQETALSNEFGHTEEMVSLAAKTKEESREGAPFEREDIVEDSQVNEGKDAFQFVPDCDSRSIEESNEIQLLDLILENICFLFSDDKYRLDVMEENPLVPPEHENISLAPPAHENMKAVICDHEVTEAQPVISLLPVTEVISENKQVNTSPPYFQLQFERSNEKDLVEDRSLNQFTKVNSPCFKECSHRLAAEMLEGDQTQSITGKDDLPLPTESVNSANPVSEPPYEISDYTKESETPQSLLVSPGQSKIQNSKSSAVKSEKRSALGSISSKRGQPSSAIPIQTDKTDNKIRGDDVSVGVEGVSVEDIENRSKAKPLSACFEDTKNEVYTPEREKISPNTLMLNSSNRVSGPPSEITDYNKESETPQSLFVSPGQSKIQNSKSSAVKSEKRSALGCISSRRGKSSSASLIQTDKIENMIRGDDVSAGVEEVSGENIENRSKAKALSACFEETENEVYTPDKEKISPDTLMFNSSNRVSGPPSEITDYNKESETPQSFFVSPGQSKIQNSKSSAVKSEKRSALGSISSKRGQPSSAIPIQTDKTDNKIRGDNVSVGVEEISVEDIENRSKAKPLSACFEDTENEVYTPDKEKISPNTLMLNSCNRVSGPRSEITDYNKESETPQSLFVSPGQSKIQNSKSSAVKSEKRSALGCISSRRGQPSSASLIQTGKIENMIRGDDVSAGVEEVSEENIENRSKAKPLSACFEEAENEVCTPDKKIISPNTLMFKSLQKSSSKLGELKNSESRKFSPLRVVAPLSIKILGREQTFEEEDDPEKENFSPNSLLLKSKKKSKLGETKNSKSSRLSFSNVIFSPGFQPEESTMATSDKENQTSKVLLLKPTSDNLVNLGQQTMVIKGRTNERAPFQSLFDNSASKRRWEGLVSAATQTDNLVNRTEYMEKNPYKNNSIGEGKKNWMMVVDAASLLDKESRKSLQLLQGLKGTRIVFPRMVIRELDHLKRQGSFFRRREATAILDWVEECMVKTSWWIHVQSSVEQERATAPTPPATPQARSSEETHWWSLSEIATPTAEDHILECALLFRTMKKDNGQLVLLSNDVTLKIKAMAEGLLCETAQEFRESLINTFSERFLWTDSSPRGRTWSHLDDVVLREKYNHFPSRKSLKEGAKGLKLILLHNSQYGRKSSIR